MTKHLSELLDLTAVVEAANRAQILEHIKLGARELGATEQLSLIAEDPDAAIDVALDGMRPTELQQLRTIALRIVYAGVRVAAEQAYALAWDRARSLVDERTGEADETLGTLDSDPADVPDDQVPELNPFAESQVAV